MAYSLRNEPDSVARFIPSGLEASALQVTTVDVCHEQNGQDHHTSRYYVMTNGTGLVVRRGQPFQLKVTLNRDFDFSKDIVSFIFSLTTDPKPSYGKGTFVVVPLYAKGTRTEAPWTAFMQSASGPVVTALLSAPASCIIGQWSLEVDTRTTSDGIESRPYCFSSEADIYILFNAWCKDDQVYIPHEDWRKEYVELDSGKIWKGTWNRLNPCNWNYNQYDQNILDCALNLITDIGKVRSIHCNDPVRIARALSAAMTSNNNGVLWGSWTESDFDEYSNPYRWVGSREILQQFYEFRKPVKYGQCWVFAGILTSAKCYNFEGNKPDVDVCRSIGLPCRPVTTYTSGHDTKGSLTIDFVYDEEGNVVPSLTEDSDWNFHVWNEVWMRRPDLLPGDYDGWNAIDSTPQELSDNMFRCGPASVKAVQRGEVMKPYDTEFLYSEVNAERVFWKCTDTTKPLKLLERKKNDIGKFISTKSVGSGRREDITANYKLDEDIKPQPVGNFFLNHVSSLLFNRFTVNQGLKNVNAELLFLDDVMVGSPFNVTVILKNMDEKDHNVSVRIIVDSVYYTGKRHHHVRKEHHEIVVKNNSDEIIKMPVTYKDYHHKLANQNAFKVTCFLRVQETQYEHVVQEKYRLRVPDVSFEINEELVEGKEFTGICKLKNPLDKPLTKCKFYIEGPNLQPNLRIKIDHDIEPHGTVATTFKMTPVLAGMTTIGARFYSHQLKDIDGHIEKIVKSSK